MSSVGLSSDAEAVMRLLAEKRCVLIEGVPGVGKTRLMAEIRRAFESVPAQGAGRPRAARGRPVSVPRGAMPGSTGLSPAATDRSTWQTAMGPSSRFREFWRGIEPSVGVAGAFRVSEGVLWSANEHALKEHGASLVIVDEINRGPAVEVFGPSIVSIEGDKRLRPDGSAGPQTVSFQLPDSNGNFVPYALSSDLYLLAAMNRADVSAEALDGAFLRRWAVYRLEPSEAALLDWFGLNDLSAPLPDQPASPDDVYAAAAMAWRVVNDRIALGLGEDYRIGHGIFMPADSTAPAVLHEALAYVQGGWDILERHVREVFFGNVEAIADVLRVGQVLGHPYEMAAEEFAGADVFRLKARTPTDTYALLRAVAQG